MASATYPLRVIFSRSREFDSRLAIMEEVLCRELGALGPIPITIAPHLYDWPPDAPLWRELAASHEDLVILCTLYPRAAFWVLQAHGVSGRWLRTRSWPAEEDLGEGVSASGRSVGADAGPEEAAPEQGRRNIWCFDTRGFPSPEKLLEELSQAIPAISQALSEARAESRELASERIEAAASEQRPVARASEPHRRLPSKSPVIEVGDAFRPRWYPVVDYSRCRNCLQCLNFCLFGVFRLDARGKLQVAVPDACRDGCPACARLCPSGAIMFPMYADPIIAGGEGGTSSPPALVTLPANVNFAGVDLGRSDLLARRPTQTTDPGLSNPGGAGTADLTSGPTLEKLHEGVRQLPTSPSPEKSGSCQKSQDLEIKEEQAQRPGSGTSAGPPTPQEVERLLREIDSFGSS